MDWLSIARSLAQAPDDPDALAALTEPPPPPDLAAPPDPPGLAAPPPPPEGPAAWHAGRLAALAGDRGDPLERRFHARRLWHLLDPGEPAARPLVSVIVTTYNRAGEVERAIDSALAQDHPATEVVVVDDASQDDTPARLAAYGERIRVVARPVNGGVAAARNSGIFAAAGDYLQFLDSDDALLPGCLSLKVAAFLARPQAGLCFSDFSRADRPEDPPGESGFWVPVGAPHCATRAPAFGLIGRFLTYPSCIMLPRHLTLALGAFDPRLRQQDDRHFYGKLGLAGAMPIALSQPLTWMRQHEASLSRRPDEGHYAFLAAFPILNALLLRPDLWPVARGPIAMLFWRGTWTAFDAARPPAQMALVESFLETLDALAAGRLSPGYSPAPLAADIAQRLAEMRAVEPWEGELSDRLDAALRRCLEARPPGPADLALWNAHSFDPAFNAAAFRLIFAQMDRDLRRGRPWLPLAEMDRRPMRAIEHPAKRRWRRLARLARMLGEGAAARLARRLGG